VIVIGQIRYLCHLIDALPFNAMRARLPSLQRTHLCLGEHLGGLICIGRLYPLPGLLTGIILLRPLIRLSTAASRH
jgi:hypothetical protein